jgi:arsenite-transporting ATPase
MEIDSGAALDRWLSGKKSALRIVAERGTYFDREDLDEMLDLSLPGVDELIGLVEISRAARKAAAEVVIVDTAPTGHTLRLLAMPETLRRVAVVFEGMQAKHRYMKESIAGVYRADATDEVIASIAEEGSALAELIADPSRCRFTWVLVPEELAVLETLDGLRELEALGVEVDEIIVNRVTPAPRGRCAYCSMRREREAAALEPLRELLSSRTVRVIEALEVEPRGLERLALVADARGTLPRATKRRERAVPMPSGDPSLPRALIGPSTKLLFVGGKGGTGKTTIAATLALKAARERGARVLVLSTDPAHSLGDVLDLELGDDERKARNGLHARELDAPSAFAEKRDRWLTAVDDLFGALAGGSSFDLAFDREVLRDLFDLAPPGLDELFAILTVIEALPRYDLAVIDTAPTGHTLRLLEIPAIAREWVRVFMRIVLKYRRVIGLGDLAAELVELSKDLRDLETLLHDPSQTRFIAVTRASALPRLETTRLIEALEREQIALGGVVLNAITPKSACARCTRARLAEAREARALERDLASRRAEGLAMILTPARAVPPRGSAELEAFGTSWAKRS